MKDRPVRDGHHRLRQDVGQRPEARALRPAAITIRLHRATSSRVRPRPARDSWYGAVHALLRDHGGDQLGRVTSKAGFGPGTGRSPPPGRAPRSGCRRRFRPRGRPSSSARRRRREARGGRPTRVGGADLVSRIAVGRDTVGARDARRRPRPAPSGSPPRCPRRRWQDPAHPAPRGQPGALEERPRLVHEDMCDDPRSNPRGWRRAPSPHARRERTALQWVSARVPGASRPAACPPCGGSVDLLVVQRPRPLGEGGRALSPLRISAIAQGRFTAVGQDARASPRPFRGLPRAREGVAVGGRDTDRRRPARRACGSRRRPRPPSGTPARPLPRAVGAGRGRRSSSRRTIA